MSTSTDILAMDLEILDRIENFNAWRQHRPLSISCVGLSYNHGGRLKTGNIWSKRTAESVGLPISERLAKDIVRTMYAWTLHGGTIVTWNGLAFDLIVLADASDMRDVCREIALGDRHVDMMFNIYMWLGYNVGLETACVETTGTGKFEGMKGGEAIELWHKGGHERVLKYVEGDARMTRDLFIHLESSMPVLKWRTQGGLGQPRQAHALSTWSPLWSVERMLRDKEPPDLATFMDHPPTLKSFLEVWDQ